MSRMLKCKSYSKAKKFSKHALTNLVKTDDDRIWSLEEHIFFCLDNSNIALYNVALWKCSFKYCTSILHERRVEFRNYLLYSII